MDLARNNFSTLVYGNGGGRRPATCVYATIVSWPAGGGHNVGVQENVLAKMVNSLGPVAHICSQLFRTFGVHSAYMRTFCLPRFQPMSFSGA